MGEAVLDVGQLVRVRGQQWVVSALSSAALPADELAAATLPGRTLVTLTSVSEDDLGEELSVVWEGRSMALRLGTRRHPGTAMDGHRFSRKGEAVIRVRRMTELPMTSSPEFKCVTHLNPIMIPLEAAVTH